MNHIVFIGFLVGNLTVTSYQPKESQTDSSPWTTSIGERVHPHGVAVSRDLLKRWGGSIQYGDWVYIDRYGLKVVNDCMAEKEYDRVLHKYIPIRNHIDIWVPNLKEEAKVGRQSRKVWLLKRKVQ